MGLLTNSASFVRFNVEGEPPADFWNFVAERVTAHAFRDIDDNYDERSVGWVSALNMFDSEFASSSYAAGDYVVLSLRIDERKVPPAALKKFAMKEEERIKRERQVPKLSRDHRSDIKESVRLMLLKRAVPLPAVYDLAWSLADNTVLFFSTSQKAIGEIEEFFKESFDLHLIQQIPYLTAGHLLAPELADRLADITPEILI
ncbi:MAG: recombination-associated protein RdgC [Desulfurivibrionaceae bacterium]|nr:recombination-associated protein RdgC [Desulfobulbales bacterium]MDT8335402.1 recombination-associated protein RdgC [Desulfurivibrionaceae bacterium]